MEYNKFLPIEVIKDNKKLVWYIDVSKLGISDLLNLRNELIGTQSYSIVKLDGIIYDEIGYLASNMKTKNRDRLVTKQKGKRLVKDKYYGKKRRW